MYVVANFKETQLAGITPGRPAEIDLDAYPSKHLSGTVSSLSSATGSRFALLPPDNASGNFVKVVQRVPVRIAIVSLPAELALRAGLSAEVTVDVR
jgi:membrane fusion protein (multidrug efflux system)